MTIRFDPDVKLYSGTKSKIRIEHQDLEAMIAAAEALSLKEREEENQMRIALISAEKALNDAKVKLKKTNFRNRKAYSEARKAAIKAQELVNEIKDYFGENDTGGIETEEIIEVSDENLDEDEIDRRRIATENALLNKKI